MANENLSRYLWKGLDLKRYSVIKIIPQDETNAVIIMHSTDPDDPHWCLEYMGGGHYFDTARQLMDTTKADSSRCPADLSCKSQG